MKKVFRVSQDEMVIYKEALRDRLIVTLPGVEGKHLMNDLEVSPISDNIFELSVEYGNVAKRGTSKRDSKRSSE